MIPKLRTGDKALIRQGAMSCNGEYEIPVGWYEILSDEDEDGDFGIDAGRMFFTSVNRKHVGRYVPRPLSGRELLEKLKNDKTRTINNPIPELTETRFWRLKGKAVLITKELDMVPGGLLIIRVKEENIEYDYYGSIDNCRSIPNEITDIFTK